LRQITNPLLVLARAYAQAYQNSRERKAELPSWLHRYNWHRPHTGIDVKHPSLISPAVTRSIPSTCHLYDLLLHEQCPICVNEAPLRGLGIAAHAAASEG
jgi:hypothetical protein